MIYGAGGAFRFLGSNTICGGALAVRAYLLAPRFRKDADASRSAVAIAGIDAVCLQCVHDVRMVWPCEIQAELVAARGDGELGHRVLRILAGGAGQSLGQRRLYARAAENHAGGDHAGGVRRLLGLVPQGAAGVESGAGFFVYRYRCVFDFSQMVVTVPRMLSSATSALTRVFGALWRCAADP